MTEEEFKAFKNAWECYPSQDNEGYLPDRGGFKAGWAAALRWYKDREEKLKKREKCLDELAKLNKQLKLD